MEEIRWRSRGYLPHFDQPGLIQGVTFHLWDSIPEYVLRDLVNDPELAANPLKRERIEAYLNAGLGCCYLKNPQVAAIVENAILHFDNKRYRLYAWVVMPNHVHVLIERFENYPLDDILHSWKSYTANEANLLLGRQGKFWFREYYDRFIRNEKHFARAVDYIHKNPVAAGLVNSAEEFRFSSARLVKDWRDVAAGRFRL
jgi:REP element-mobilizing transposase RayT